MKTRRYEIAEHMMGQKQFLTSQQLAETFSVSIRTIKSDMKQLASEASQIGIKVSSSTKLGYSIELKNKSMWKKILEEFSQNDLNLQANRIRAILNTLLISNDYVSYNILAKKVNVSISTLNKDLQTVYRLIEEEGLRFETARNKGIRVIGNELYMRKLISKYVDIDLTSIDSYNRIYASRVFSYDELKSLTNEILRIFNDHEINLLGMNVTNLLIHIIISSYRIKTGYEISFIDKKVDQARIEYQVSQDIAHILEKNYLIKFGEYEIEYLALSLMSKGLRNDANYQEIRDLILMTYEQISESYDVQFNINDDYSNALIYHVQAMKDRLKHGASIQAEVIEMVREKFVLAYEMALIYQEKFYTKFKLDLNDVELCYLALHFGAMLENLKIKEILPKLYIISELRTGNVLLLKNECIANLGHMVNVEGIFSPYEIHKLDIKPSDYVLSTEEIQNKRNLKMMTIPSILGKESIEKIKAFIEEDGLIADLFNHRLFFIEERSNLDVEIFLKSKTQFFQQIGFVEDAESFYKLTLDRELLQSTRYASIVCLPHPIRASSSKSFISTILIKQGIRWFDGQMVKLIFYIGIKPKEKNATKSFQVLSSITSHPELIQEILACQNYEEFINHLHKMQKREQTDGI